MLDALIFANEPRAGDRPILGRLAAARRIAAVEVLGEFAKALQRLGLEPAVGQFLDAVRQPVFEEAPVTVSLRPGRFDGGGMRYLRFTNWLTEIDRLSGPIAAIYFEEVRRHVGTDAAHIYGGFLATLTAWCESHAISYQGVPVGTIKRHIAARATPTRPR